MRRRMLVLVCLLVMIFSAFSLDFDDKYFMPQQIRNYRMVLMPFRKFYFDDNVRIPSSITVYETSFKDGREDEETPQEYRFTRLGYISGTEMVSDSTVKDIISYEYNEDNDVVRYIDQRYVEDQPYLTSEINFIKLTANGAIQYIRKKIDEVEKLTEEAIYKKDDYIFYVYEETTKYEEKWSFNDRGLLLRIDKRSQHPRLEHIKTQSYALFEYDDLGRMARYEQYYGEEESFRFAFNYHYDPDTGYLKNITDEDNQFPTTHEIISFLEYDSEGNWLKLKRTYYDNGESYKWYVLERKIEYWD